MQRSRITLLLVATLIGTTTLSGCDENTAQQSATPQAVPVGVINLKSQTTTLTTELPGRVSAFQIAQIRPQVTGIIQSRLFTEGSVVSKGQALYQIDPATFEAQVAVSEAAVARAQASIAINKSKAERYKELLKIKAVSQQDYDEADGAYKQANAELLTAKAQLQTAKINLDYSLVSSPISGQISKSDVTVGALVSANQASVLATVTQLDPIYVDLTQASSELTKLKQALASGSLSIDEVKQTQVKLKLEGGSEYAHTGTLQFSEVSVNPGTGSVTLRAKFPNPEQLLLPGMYVRAEVVEGVKNDAILAPQRGISRNNKGQATAMVVTKDNTVQSKVLKVDRTIGSNWLVSEGLNEGDKLIVEGLQKIRPGALVNPSPIATASTTDAQ
ncbi:efflux RND transporter periplasmic adaptor subunit [Pseudoalteromonas sp. MMG010]|uniref:efflux RND transporter periplasmic adaptor subunit n=1 Tax=Pseudoalteromonas sp. MMG010 TaxID=2822685 RepID=UPI001B3A7681|nr:efflux RND transporter periplasmic adaptor subunit [Pseudoalteromonas sp. MMG010]MBQ4833721.1 efflux RND transporter periplasmic adaptor subunit [Pseudoalteromonas sp. MMG010]